jgi:hypothetical protein
MAGLTIMTNPLTEIEYKVLSGIVTYLCIDGELLLDMFNEPETVVDGWEDRLVDLVKKYNLDVDDGKGLHAFVYRLIKKGRLPNKQEIVQ